MPTISWKPLPETVEDPKDPAYGLGAIERARHRALMALRWRNKELRDADRKKRRLPQDWHDWMSCPAEDGYRSRWCTCDAAISNAPRDIMLRERELRAQLERELSSPHPSARRRATTLPMPMPVAVEWVKTIDASALVPSILPRRRRAHVQGPVATCARLAASGSRPLSVRSSAQETNPRRRVGGQRRWGIAGRLSGLAARLRLPTWLARFRSRVPVV